MGEAALQHQALEDRLLRGRADQSLDADQEDAILDEMERLWWQMDDAEHRQAEERARRYVSSQ